MSALILVEHDNRNIQASTRNVLTAALQLHTNPTLLVAGSNCRAVAEQAAALQGVHSVWYLDHEEYAHAYAENISQLVVELGGSFQVFMAAATTFGKNILPRIAALLDVAQISDVTQIVNANTFVHPIYAGNALETVRVMDDRKVLSIRTTAFEAVTVEQTPCTIETIDKIFTDKRVEFVGHKLNKSTRPELGNAKIIVSGGRGLQSAEKFKLVEELADALGAAVGASRAAVDAGFVPNDYQVGQTGKVVAPTLYIALGISGAVQHLAGMKDSKVIVAINKDEDAPIFQIADYGLVGDLFVLVPEIIEQLKK